MSSWKMSDSLHESRLRVIKARNALEDLLKLNADLTAQLESLQEHIREAQQELNSAIFLNWATYAEQETR